MLTLGYCTGNGASIEPFDEIFQRSVNLFARKESAAEVDAVVFWGGTDIHWSYYNQPPHDRNQVAYSKTPSSRDVFEWQMMKYCQVMDIPMIGVCRGAQMMCVFAGGDLIQHTQGHDGGRHPIVTKDGEILEVTSAHHQMMYPFDIPHEMLAWSKSRLGITYEIGGGKKLDPAKVEREPEVVYFPTVRGLAIQGHPEWMNTKSDFNQWIIKLVKDKLLTEEVQQ